MNLSLKATTIALVSHRFDYDYDSLLASLYREGFAVFALPAECRPCKKHCVGCLQAALVSPGFQFNEITPNAPYPVQN